MANPVYLEYSSSDIMSGGLYIYAQVAGGKIQEFQIDTGSSGMIIGQDALSGIDVSQFPCYGPGQMTYEPSGNVRSGTWYYLPVILYSGSPNDTNEFSNQLSTFCMVLVVDDPATFSGGMMGVTAKPAYPCYNAFFNCISSGTALPPGYVLTQNNVIIGVTQDNPPFSNFIFASMTPAPDDNLPSPPQLQNQPSYTMPSPALAPSWLPPNVNVSIYCTPYGISLPYSLVFELDTGINSMLFKTRPTDEPLLPGVLSPTANANQQQVLPDVGNGVTISLLENGTSGSSLLDYYFWVGTPPAGATPSTNPPPTPSEVLYLGLTAGTSTDLPRMNVGIGPLMSYNYMFDGRNGVIGFAPIVET